MLVKDFNEVVKVISTFLTAPLNHLHVVETQIFLQTNIQLLMWTTSQGCLTYSPSCSLLLFPICSSSNVLSHDDSDSSHHPQTIFGETDVEDSVGFTSLKAFTTYLRNGFALKNLWREGSHIALGIVQRHRPYYRPCLTDDGIRSHGGDLTKDATGLALPLGVGAVTWALNKQPRHSAVMSSNRKHLRWDRMDRWPTTRSLGATPGEQR
ncbi:uncharacterized protein LOC106559441 [Canis lupus familiaris]|uniref:uncharacterized protein LOC106559441 n=1 Tax=Canis lupus familiaris TaxID=9615 RepID=UPI000BAA1364|nr:uncharacterized protein LOC106559441 [Canis lupus familiaris]XP_038407446.1 uncharacterized protein LOC106559441 [Canis lupus familiaris]XP_038536770.1 uncharacterized protein LOC106559441 [Canis lupus familiaris]|eukprot:XP_022280560.1 uncharacterized protein LOC106559441 [Canis lupus familiaris]